MKGQNLQQPEPVTYNWGEMPKLHISLTQVDSGLLGYPRSLLSVDDYLVSGGYNGNIKIWDPQTWNCLHTFKRSDSSVDALAVLPNKHIVSGHSGGNVEIWDSLEGHVKTLLNDSFPALVTAFAILSNGYLAIGGNNNIKICNVDTGQCLQNLEKDIGLIKSLAVLSDNKLASGNNNKIKIWDIETGKLLQKIKVHTDNVNAFAVLQNSYLASGSSDHTIKLWDPRTWQCVQLLQGHNKSVYALAELTDEKLVSGSKNDTIMIWDLQTGKCLQTIKTPQKGPIMALAVLSNGQLASANIKAVNIYSFPKNQFQVNMPVDKSTELDNELTILNKFQSISANPEIFTLEALEQPSSQVSSLASNNNAAPSSPIIANKLELDKKEDILEKEKTSSSISVSISNKQIQATPSLSIQPLNYNNSNLFFNSRTSSSINTPVRDTFTAWLEEIKQQGHFSILVDNKDVQISFESYNQANEDVEDILIAFDEKLTAIPKFQKILVEDRDIQNNCLIIKTKAKLDAKKINNLLEKQYELTTSGPKSPLTLNQ